VQQRGPWQVLGTRQVYANPWMRVREDQVLRPNGTPGIYGVVEFVPAVGVVALTGDEQVYLVGQYRYPTNGYSWEIVTGYADPSEELVRSVGAARRSMRVMRCAGGTARAASGASLPAHQAGFCAAAISSAV
jgi:hypothetical protein